MTTKIELSFKPYLDRAAEEQIHNLGNIADNIWKEKMYLWGGRIEDDRYIATMILIADHKLRKKDKDTLLSMLKKLDPKLDAKLKI